MFLCDNCHNPNLHFAHRSLGLCECCGKKAACIDCHYQPQICFPKKATRKLPPKKGK